MKRGLLLVAGAVVLAGCGGGAVREGVVQTRAPGHVSAGGHTSGEVMAANTPAGAVQPGPSGTPGIPRGAEGNVGGTALGATVDPSTRAAAQGSSVPPPPAAPAASAASSAAATEAQAQARALAASMDAVAARWRQRAAAQGAPLPAQTAVDAGAGIQASQVPAPAPPRPVRSEKAGTAPPSADVKTPTKPRTDPRVGAEAPDAAGHRP